MSNQISDQKLPPAPGQVAPGIPLATPAPVAPVVQPPTSTPVASPINSTPPVTSVPATPIISASPTSAPVIPPQPAVAAPTTSPTASTTAPAAQTKVIGKYKVEVINEKCIGAASCVAIASQVFQLTEQNIAAVISQDGADDDTKLLAAQSCPTSAIIVTDTQTGQKVWPLD